MFYLRSTSFPIMRNEAAAAAAAAASKQGSVPLGPGKYPPTPPSTKLLELYQIGLLDRPEGGTRNFVSLPERLLSVAPPGARKVPHHSPSPKLQELYHICLLDRPEGQSYFSPEIREYTCGFNWSPEKQKSSKSDAKPCFTKGTQAFPS